MSISSTTRKAGPFTGNDSTTVFPFAFKVFQAADLRVVQLEDGVEDDLTLNSDFTVVLNADQDASPGGTVTLDDALATGTSLVITSDIDALQPMELTNAGGFYPRTLNDSADRQVILIQQLAERVDRSLKLPVSSTATTELPAATVRANGVLGFDEAGAPSIYTQASFKGARGERGEKGSDFVGVNPKDYGAIGDGNVNPISNDDIAAHPEWIGTYTVGDSWDYVGIQEAFYAAFATTSTPGNVLWNCVNTVARVDLNRTMFIPNGSYHVNRQLVLVASGFVINGAGRRAATIIWGGASNLALLYCNAISYGHWSDIGFETSVPTSEALVELDYDGTYASLKTQQVTFDTCMWNGNGIGAIGCRVSKTGGGAQGDTIVFLNPYIGGCTFAGLAVGVASAQNALGITVIGGDIQACFKYGIYVAGGQVFVNGMSFQNQSSISGSAIVHQIANGGADLYCIGGSGPGGNSSMVDVRSESEVLCRASGTTVRITGASVNTSTPTWLPNHAYAVGNLVHGTTGAGEKGEKGRTFLCVQAGTSAALLADEPTWDSVSRGISSNTNNGGVTTVAGGGAVTGNMEKLPSGAAPSVGDYIAIVGAAASSAFAAYQVDSVTSSSSISVTPSPANNLASADFYLGTPITDGTVKWIDVDFDSVSGCDLRQVSMGSGRIGSACKVIENVTAARPDALRAEAVMGNTLPGTDVRVVNLRCTTGDLNQTYVAFNPLDQDGYDNDGPLRNSFSIATGGRLEFVGGTGHAPYPHNALELQADGSILATGGLSGGATLSLTPAATIDLVSALRQSRNLRLVMNQDITLSLSTLVEGLKFSLLWKSDGATNRTLTFNGSHFRLPSLAVTTGTAGLYSSVEFFVADGKANRLGVASALVG